MDRLLRPHQTDETSCKYRHCNKCDCYRKQLEEYKDAEDNGLLLPLPCKIGATVYVLTKCKDLPSVLDGNYETATGYYCPYELYDKCPHTCDWCEEAADKLTVFEDTVRYIGYDETGLMLYCELTQFCSTVGENIFLTREAAEKALAEREAQNGR